MDPLISFELPCTVRLPGGLPGFLLLASLITFGAVIPNLFILRNNMLLSLLIILCYFDLSFSLFLIDHIQMTLFWCLVKKKYFAFIEN